MKRNKNYKPDGKQCINCLADLTENNIRKCDIAQANYICKSCRKLRDKERYTNKKEIIREQQRGYDLANKIKIVREYGEKCMCCGENNYEFLTISYLNKENNRKINSNLFSWLIKNNFPKDNYHLLCYNCNCAKENFGYCPHQSLAGIRALKASVLDGSTSEAAVSRSPAAKLL